MLAYIARRGVAAFLVLGLTTMITFAIFFLGPSNPAQPVCDGAGGGRCTAERLNAIEEAMGLNENVVVAYGKFAKGLVAGREVTVGAATYDCGAPCFGVSYGTRTLVTDELKDKFPATVALAIGGATIYLTTGVLLGSLAARWRGTTADRLLVGSTLLISAIPYYLIALLAWIFLTLRFNIFPETGYFPLTEDPIKMVGGLLLPWLVLGLTNSTQYARFSRGQMVETLGEDFIRSASAKGVSTNKTVFKHALRAAMVPVVTIFGLDFAALLAGTVFTEQIFEIDGIGKWGLEALRAPQDFPIITCVVIVGAALVVIGNLVVDILYGFLDPRVRLS